jgi:hypothetical protein
MTYGNTVMLGEKDSTAPAKKNNQARQYTPLGRMLEKFSP